MTFKYENVYIKETSTVAGPYEKKGPLRKYVDKIYILEKILGKKQK